jgi:hypothetical protein
MEKGKKYIVQLPSTTKVVDAYHTAVAEIEYEWRRFSNAAQRTLFHFSAAIFGPEGSVEAVFQDGRWGR